MIVMTMGQRVDGTDTAEADWAGRTIRVETKTGAEQALARMLTAAGAADGPWCTVRDGTVCLHGASLHLLAARVVSEGDAGITVTWWRRHPLGAADPVLDDAIAAARERHQTARAARHASHATPPHAPAGAAQVSAR